MATGRPHQENGNPAHAIATIAVLLAILMGGCSGNGPVNPIIPDNEPDSQLQLTQSSAPEREASNRGPCGFWKVILDRETMAVDFVPLRTGSLHINVVNILNSTMGVSASIDSGDSDPANGLFAVDITLTHPFETSPQFAGFDVKGILITPGSFVVGPLVFAGAGETRLVNADAYTRWWNPNEFPGSGILGYVPGIMGTPNASLLTATVNPYKYFCDYLESEQDLEDIVGLPLDDDAGRGVFTAGSSNTRRYMIQFPMSPGPQVVFNYAVDASWHAPDPNPPGEIPDDFPIKANQSEAYHLVASDPVNTLFYDPDLGGGGNLWIWLEVADWQGRQAGSIADEISTVRLFAPELFTGGVTMDLYHDSIWRAEYVAKLDGMAVPSRPGEHQVIIRVGSDDGLHYNTYAPGAPDEPISAYQVLWVDVAEVECAADDNNDFGEAEPIGFQDEVHGTLCRPGGDLIDYADYYTFDISPDNGLIGVCYLYAWANQVFCSLYDSTYAKIAESEAIGGEAMIDLGDLHLVPGTYYLRVLTQNEVDTIYYMLEMNAEEMAAYPPVITEQISGPLYPRNRHDTVYEIGVSSLWPVTYTWDIERKDDGFLFGPFAGEPDGTLVVRFNDFCLFEGEAEITCVVSNGLGGPVSADPYTCWVNGRIFHADLDDETTGDNVGWSWNDQYGGSSWTSVATTDGKLEGTGRKFAPADTDYQPDSGDVLVSPAISLPSAMGLAHVTFRHSFDLELRSWMYGEDYWRGYDGGNVKITEAPTLPTHGDPPAESIGGRPYWSVLSASGTPMAEQEAFCGTSGILSAPYALVTSAIEISPAFAGSDIHIGFAVSTDSVLSSYRGWLIDDVSVYIEGDVPNEAPDVGALEGQDLTPNIDDLMDFHISALDPDGDEVFRTWSVWDFRWPGRKIDPLYCNPTGYTLQFVPHDLWDLGYGNRYHVTVDITDCFDTPERRDSWVVVGGLLFGWDPDDPNNLEFADWDVGFDEDSDSTWHGPHATDGVLGGHGYKFADSNINYTAGDEAALFTPPILIPPGFSSVLVLFAHYYQFNDDDGGPSYIDGGNIHVLDAASYMDDFDWSNPPLAIAGGHGYAGVLEPGSALEGQLAFSDDENPGLLRVTYAMVDPSWIGDPDGIRLGFAASSNDTTSPKRGWMVDEVILIGYE